MQIIHEIRKGFIKQVNRTGHIDIVKLAGKIITIVRYQAANPFSGYRLLEDGSVRLLEDGSGRLME